MSSSLEPTGPVTEMELATNRFTPDAEQRVAQLRAMAEAFPDEADPRPLSPAEIRVARRTTPEGLEKAAAFVRAAPGGLGSAIANADELRDAIGFELAYGHVRDEARALSRRIDMAILRRKLKAVKSARGLYRVAKEFLTIDKGDLVRTHVRDMKRTLGNRRKKAAAVPPPLPELEPAAKKQ